MTTIIRFAIITSLLLSIGTVLVANGPCYVCHGNAPLYVVLLHMLLLLSTFAKNPVMNVLALTLVVFYASRPFIIQIDPETYTYSEFVPVAPAALGHIMLVALLICLGLVLGCFVGGIVGRGYRGKLSVIPFSRTKDELQLYRILTSFFIVGQLVLLYLFVRFGVGLPINRTYFSLDLLRIAKAAKMVSVFGLVPIAWLIMRRPKGIEKTLAVVAVICFVLVHLSSLSKVSLIYAVLPFLLISYAAGMKISSRLAMWSAIAGISVILFMATFLANVRIDVAYAFSTGNMQRQEVQRATISENVLNIMSRVGSTFDVLSFVVLHRTAFAEHGNLSGEVLDVVNGFVPGGLIDVNAPRWSEILYSLGHGGDLEAQLRIATGENITLPAHMYIYGGIAGSVLLGFLVMFVLTIVYRRSRFVVVRGAVLAMIIMGISNGSGIVSLGVNLIFLFVSFFLPYATYRLVRALFGRSFDSVPLSQTPLQVRAV